MIASSALEQGSVIQDVAKNIVLLADQISANQHEFNDNLVQTQDLAGRAHTLRSLTAKFTIQ
jgi:methyl-accepting chemotaxis protein